MPALTLSTENAALDAQPTYPATTLDNERDRSSSPARPSYSPITPVFPSASLVRTAGTYQHGSPQSSVSPLPAVPISESENPDAIALRSAISILQLQRQQSVRDLQKLEVQKRDAVADSRGFAEELVAGRISMRDNRGLVGLPSISSTTRTTEESAIEEDLSDSEVRNTPTQTPRFGPIPTPQNIVRCPPINWAKYHVIGDSLHKLHEEQRLRPASGEPQKDERRAPVHVIAAPYRPFEDKIADPPMRTRSTSKKG